MNPADFRTIDVRAGGRLKIDQKARGQSQWRRDASEFYKLNIDLPKGKLLQSFLRINYIVFNEPNPRILCVLIHDTWKRIQVRRIRWIH
jgi:hypothetical protein